MRRRPAPAVCAAVLAVLASVSLDASLIVPAELRALAVEAQSIVFGRVVEVRGQVRRDRRRIDSVVVMAVGEAVKGPRQQTVVFRTLGGQVGRYRTIVPGAPAFAPGDEAVIFFGRGAVPYPIGLSHGVFRVRRDGSTEERRILSPPTLRDPRNVMTVRRSDGERVAMPLDRFLAMVRRAAARQP